MRHRTTNAPPVDAGSLLNVALGTRFPHAFLAGYFVATRRPVGFPVLFRVFPRFRGLLLRSGLSLRDRCPVGPVL
jgi:hypothetical protein